MRAGDVLAKARLAHEVLDVCAPHDGLLEQILVPAGERFSPGRVLARDFDF